MTGKGDITSSDDLALDGLGGFSELIDSCTDLARKFLLAFFPDAVSVFPVSRVLLFLWGKGGRTAEEERTEDGGRREGRGCEQGMEVGAKSEAVLLSREPGWRISTIRLSGVKVARRRGIQG